MTKYTQGEKGKRAPGYNFEEQQHLRGRKQKEHTEEAGEMEGDPERAVTQRPKERRAEVWSAVQCHSESMSGKY